MLILNADKDRLAEALGIEMEKRGKIPNAAYSKKGGEGFGHARTRAYLNVQTGCRQFCTYCVIPYVRGELKSRDVFDAIGEARSLAEAGFKEIVVTGIHLSSYGADGGGADAFVKLRGAPLLELLEDMADIDGIERIRLGSLEPRIITDSFAERLAQIRHICPHFHLSLQSGSDAVLKRMNRHYTVDEYLGGLDVLRSYFKNPAITTDVIVGFPGETEGEFGDTCDFVKKVGFSKMHVFKYSRRAGTAADSMDGQVDEAVKSDRSDRLIKIGLELEKKYRESSLKEFEDVLIEELVQIEGKRYAVGHNERYIKIAVLADGTDAPAMRGRIVRARMGGGEVGGMPMGFLRRDAAPLAAPR